MSLITIAYHSGCGHTKKVAEHVAEETPGKADLDTSEKFGARVAEVVLRWNK
jgi:flavodoxin